MEWFDRPFRFATALLNRRAGVFGGAVILESLHRRKCEALSHFSQFHHLLGVTSLTETLLNVARSTLARRLE